MVFLYEEVLTYKTAIPIKENEKCNIENHCKKQLKNLELRYHIKYLYNEMNVLPVKEIFGKTFLL